MTHGWGEYEVWLSISALKTLPHSHIGIAGKISQIRHLQFAFSTMNANLISKIYKIKFVDLPKNKYIHSLPLSICETLRQRFAQVWVRAKVKWCLTFLILQVQICTVCSKEAGYRGTGGFLL